MPPHVRVPPAGSQPQCSDPAVPGTSRGWTRSPFARTGDGACGWPRWAAALSRPTSMTPPRTGLGRNTGGPAERLRRRLSLPAPRGHRSRCRDPDGRGDGFANRAAALSRRPGARADPACSSPKMWPSWHQPYFSPASYRPGPAPTVRGIDSAHPTRSSYPDSNSTGPSSWLGSANPRLQPRLHTPLRSIARSRPARCTPRSPPASAGVREHRARRASRRLNPSALHADRAPKHLIPPVRHTGSKYKITGRPPLTDRER